MTYLSYPLTGINPVYGAAAMPMEIHPLKSLAKGDSCNVSQITLENHWGTHVDCPAHFFYRGDTVVDYPASAWLFVRPYVAAVPLDEDQLIGPSDLLNTPIDADFLLIQSGFGRFRGEEKYSIQNPGIHPDAGRWLREERPNVRAIGFDFISVSPFQQREIGRKAHRVFLDPNGPGHPVFIVEDMDLTMNLSKLVSALIVPMRISGIDSAPCTVIGFFSE